MARYRWISLILIVALAAAAIAGCRADSRDILASGQELSLFVATDMHYLAPSLNDQGEAFQKYFATSDGRLLDQIDSITEAFVHDVRKAKPDMLIISGDLTNNGERDSHLEMARKLARIELSGTKVFVIPGNHDIQNPWARGFKEARQYKTSSVSSSEFAKIYQAFGYGEAISRDRHSLSYLAAPSKDVWLLMLDTNVYQKNEEFGAPSGFGRIEPDTFTWIRQCSRLARESNARIVTVMHHNLLNHTLNMNYGYTLDDNEKAIEVFRECGLSLFLSGHIHIQDIEYRDRETKPIYDIVTSALTVYPVQYGILKYTPARGFDYSTARVDVEGWADATGYPDENMKGFQTYARKRFTEKAYQRGLKRLAAATGLSESDKILMAETMSLLNAHYFAGSISDIRDAVMQSRGYKLWRDADESEFSTGYINSMLYDDKIENNRLHIPDTIQK